MDDVKRDFRRMAMKLTETFGHVTEFVQKIYISVSRSSLEGTFGKEHVPDKLE